MNQVTILHNAHHHNATRGQNIIILLLSGANVKTVIPKNGMTGQNKKIVCAKADFAPECSQNYRNESVLDSYAVSQYIFRHYDDG